MSSGRCLLLAPLRHADCVEQCPSSTSQIAFIQRQRPSIRLKNEFVFNWQVHAGRYLPCVTHSATDEVIPKQECSMSNENEGHSRRQVLTTVGSLSIAGAMGQAIASSSLVSPAAAAQPNSEIAEKDLRSDR